MKKTTFVFASLLIGLNSIAANAADELKVNEVLKGSEITISLEGDFFNSTLLITGPNEFNANAFSRGNSVSIDLINAGGLDDGLYKYEVTAASSKTYKKQTMLNNGRGEKDKAKRSMSVSTTGAFFAKKGIIVKVDKNAKEDG